MPTRFRLEAGTYDLVDEVGEGGEGTVYELRPTAGDGPPLALKWYFPRSDTRQRREMIRYLVERGAPSDNFLWPLEAIETDDPRGFGYTMPLRPPGYVKLSHLLRGIVDVPFSVLCAMGIELADCFSRLHLDGLCYRDISFANIFFETSTGRPLICDNDNVGVDRGPAAVLGTPRFMAPEIVRGEELPSSDTDRFSLAVLLFYVLMVGHPLLGRRELGPWDDAKAHEMFGSNPIFVFDPDDPSNRPDPEEHAAVLANWELMPDYIRAHFVKTFTEGLRDPRNGRTLETIWRRDLVRMRDSIMDCPHCGKQNFFDADGGEGPLCWSCERRTGAPLRLEFDDWVLVLHERALICRHHALRDYDYTSSVGRVARHPDRPNLWGLRNVGRETWSMTLPSGTALDVAPGQTSGLVVGATIDFGAQVAKIVD